jgi:hypothetical protein
MNTATTLDSSRYTLTAGALLGFGILSIITAISWAI